jgi:hypothetical protein
VNVNGIGSARAPGVYQPVSKQATVNAFKAITHSHTLIATKRRDGSNHNLLYI